MKTCAILPTFNEKDNLPVLVTKLLALKIADFGIVIVDDKSPDGTGLVADRLVEKFKGKVLVIHRLGKLGLGSAYVEGMKLAFAKGARIVITMDVDGSHDPEEIPKLLRLLKLLKADVVIGSRHVPGGRIVGFGWFRNMLTGGAQVFAKYVLGIPVSDSTSGFRAYRREVIEKIGLDKIKSSGYSFLTESIYRVFQAGFRIVESPITFGLRYSGESKVSSEEIWKALVTIARLRLKPYRT